MNKATESPSDVASVFEAYHHEAPAASINNDKDWSLRRKTVMGSITKVMSKKELEIRIGAILQEITYKELNSLLNINGSKDDQDGQDGAIWYPRKCLRNAVFNVRGRPKMTLFSTLKF